MDTDNKNDVVNRIDIFLKEAENMASSKYITCEDAIKVIDYIISEVKEDEVLLNVIKQHIEKNWKRTNKQLIEEFYKIVEYYGIMGEGGFRKTVLEVKGKTVVRKFIQLKTKQRILKLLND
jgi:hypothetical protein